MDTDSRVKGTREHDFTEMQDIQTGPVQEKSNWPGSGTCLTETVRSRSRIRIPGPVKSSWTWPGTGIKKKSFYIILKWVIHNSHACWIPLISWSQNSARKLIIQSFMLSFTGQSGQCDMTFSDLPSWRPLVRSEGDKVIFTVCGGSTKYDKNNSDLLARAINLRPQNL